MAAQLAELTLPDFGDPVAEPAVPETIYAERLDRIVARLSARKIDALIVYGDREHAANIAYASGYDPRFEEAILVIVPGRTPHLMVGNEGWGYAALAKGPFERVLYQPFSLMGQPRDRLVPLQDLLRKAGVEEGMTIGTAGWKGFDLGDGEIDPNWFEIPNFLANAVRDVAGATGGVVNAVDIFMHPGEGLRTLNEPAQLAAFEYAATTTSQAVRRVLFGVRPGMSEFEAVQLMRLNGLPLSVHPMLSGGERARYGLPSPSARKLERGAPFTVAFGLAGALNCRAGFLAESAADLPGSIKDYVERLVAPFFAAVAGWYEALEIGVTGGEIFDIVHRRLGDPFFGVGLNPGHLIHLDEWVHSPIFKGSKIGLRSGMALQLDIIPATGTEYFTTNVEDGLALADPPLRDELQRGYPEAWNRIQRRRAFMEDVIGIRLKPEVLPFSNIPAYLPPFILSPRLAMCMR